MRGAAVQIPSIIPVGLLGADPALAPKRDVAGAKKLLAEAGYPNGFSVKMVYPTRVLVGGLSAETLVTKLQADLAQIGVALQLEPRETVRGGPTTLEQTSYHRRRLDAGSRSARVGVGCGERSTATKRVYDNAR
jgi:ABC-type transport system substrate-binding protein